MRSRERGRSPATWTACGAWALAALAGSYAVPVASAARAAQPPTVDALAPRASPAPPDTAPSTADDAEAVPPLDAVPPALEADPLADEGPPVDDELLGISYDPCQLPEPPPGAEPAWIDRFEQQLRLRGCYSARWIDGLFGQHHDPTQYSQVSGSVAPSVLWTEFDGWKGKMRFRVDLPLPAANGRLRAFIGRVDREEFVTERAEASGALPRQFGAPGDEQTLLGLGWSGPGRHGRGFDASAGIRVTTPLDPYVKASYRWVWPVGLRTELRLRPILFWQQSEQFGATTRFDLDHAIASDWFSRFTLSGTYSGRSLGTRGFATATLFHRLSDRRAMAYQLGADGETKAEVPLREYGLRVTHRQTVWRDYLVLELRGSVTWPREFEIQPRKPSWGAGVGFEMVFGDGQFRGTD